MSATSESFAAGIVIAQAQHCGALRCDRILVVDQGHIVESGSHADLIDRGGRYAELRRAHWGHAVIETAVAVS